ncbi:MAG: sigma 54-interacting transcriptional regulator [Acidobacteria bacterium]|nr:sigma 54-interacting transcriptional regulator [Acidobacteriota bacterium]
MEPQSVAKVLARIAETASETLELQEVFNRVAASVRELIPFDNMGVVRIVEERLAVVHAATWDCGNEKPTCSDPTPLELWSPRMRPRPGPLRIDDAETELDPSFRLDAEIIHKGVRSILWQSFRAGDAFSGGVWLSSGRASGFTEEHQQVLAPIAALLGSAVEHWRIWDADRVRRERLDQLESILATLTPSLDVREIFERIAEAVREVMPHDLMVLTELDALARTIRPIGESKRIDARVPSEPVHLTQEEAERCRMESEIFRDLPAELEPTTERNRLLLGSGMLSWLRVPVWMSGEVHGAVSFFDRERSRYGDADVEIARRIADRIALALSYQRLAEEARLAAEARERAERLEATVATLTRELQSQGRGRVIGVSRSWKHVLTQVGRVASSGTTVLITGESGTGKEVVSRLIHQGSPRSAKPLIAINCAALPEQLLESELFGHEKGAFTGAVAAKIGQLEQAAGGTLFLDEITEMSPLVQAKFLRVLQEREFQRVGGTRVLRADVRVVAATNRNLATAIARGQFREDLYYRLNVFEIQIPALRERPDDILPLAESFLDELGRTMGRPAAGISRDACQWLLAYGWPGNVRELRNAIERAILLCDGGLITHEHLPAAIGRSELARERTPAPGTDPATPLPPGGVQLQEMERKFVEQALRSAKGNKSQAARLLGLTRAQLYTRIQKYGFN